MPVDVREEKSGLILERLYALSVYNEAEVVLTYVNYQSEVLTTPLIERAFRDGKQVFVPKVQGEDMEFYQIGSLNDLEAGYKGIREPVGGVSFFPEKYRSDDHGEGKVFNDHDGNGLLMLMPGAVFDRNRHRIGYGKGFYDRYLKWLMLAGIGITTLALCYECQVLDEIPYEAHDVRPDIILTEEKLYDSFS